MELYNCEGRIAPDWINFTFADV